MNPDTRSSRVSPTALAVDIGGGSVRIARVGHAGVAGPIARRPLDASLSTAAVLDRILEAAREIDGTDRDIAAGIGIPAYLDAAGRVTFCVNLPGLNGVALASMLAGLVPSGHVVVIPDVAAAALGEARLGAGRDVERFLCAAIGTGVNAAMTIRGRLLETAAGCLGDAGHVLVEPEGPPCACGGRGCLEAVTSGLALARMGAAVGLRDAAAVVQAAREGRLEAAAIVERAGVALGRAIAIWCAMLWPERVALGGGLAAAGDLLLAPARRELARVGVPYLTRIDIVQAHLGADAGLVGCGLAALERSAPAAS